MEWTRVAWHLGGMDFESYLDLTDFDRTVLHEQISEFIEASDVQSPGPAGRGM